jgi:hypothetical protein
VKNWLACLLIIGVVVGAPARAKSSSTSMLVGRWSVDTSRLPNPPEARPRRVTITFSQAGKAELTMDVDIIYASGQEIHTVCALALNGRPSQVMGSPEADVAAIKMPQPDVLILTLGKDGHQASTRIYTVKAGGQRMTETASYYGHDGMPLLKTHYFTRIR